MRKDICFGLILFFIFISFAVFAESAADKNGNITVVIEKLKNNKGTADIALVNSTESFNSDALQPFMGAKAEIENGCAEYVFKNVPYGEYAVKFFHDENGSGKLDKGLFGIPKEEYGFSNNAVSPNYEKAKFELNQADLKIIITAR